MRQAISERIDPLKLCQKLLHGKNRAELHVGLITDSESIKFKGSKRPGLKAK